MRRILTLMFTAAALLLAAAPALADNDQRIYFDCQDNSRLDGRYTQHELRHALDHLPADLDEYTDCRDVLRRAQLAAASAGGGGGTGGGSGGGGTTGGGSGGGGTTGGVTGGGSGGGGTTGGGSGGRGTTGGVTGGASGTGAGSGGGATGGGGGAPASANPLGTATPAERQAIDQAIAGGGQPLMLAGQAIRPGAAGVRRLGGDGHDLPAPLLALLVLVAGGLAAGAALLIRDRFRDVRARGAG